MDSNDKKLKFIEAMTKHGLQHFDAGGTTQNNTSSNSITNPVGATAASGVNPMNAFTAAPQAVGNGFKQIAQDFTAQNDYQAQLAPTDYTNYQNFINQSGNNSLAGYGNFQGIQGQQQALANQLQQQANGQGPNVAQNQLNQSTAQNIANQGAMMAGQRGGSQNVGLLARQSGQQGAATQQQAIGQSATLRAQQQLAAQQGLAQQQGLMGQQNIQEQGTNNQLFGGSAGAQNAQNANNVSNYNMMQGINSGIAQNNANAVNKTTSGLMGGAATAIAALSKGGMAGKDGMKMDDHHHSIAKIYHPHMYASGGDIYSGPTTVGSLEKYNLPQAQGVDLPDPSKMMKGMMPGGSNQSDASSNTNMSGGEQMAGSDMGGGGDIGSLGSGVMAAKSGGKVNGKAKVKGDSYKNDTVPALLSAGELVIDRDTMNDKGPMGQMARALAMHIHNKNKGKEMK